MAVVELHPKLRVGKGFDDLAFDGNDVFFRRQLETSFRCCFPVYAGKTAEPVD